MISALSFGLLLGVCLLVVRIADSYFRLRGIPGPFLAHFTDLWRFSSQNIQGHAARLIHLHEKHGKLVRIGPNHISISDPDAVPIVYATNPSWIKGPSYYGAVPVSKSRAVPSIIAMSESQHTGVRKSVGRAFTTNSLLDYEDSIETTAQELVDALSKVGDTEVDIGLWLQFFAMDVLIRIAFSDSLGLMEKGQDIDGTLAAVMGRFDHWGRWGAMPGADYILNKSALATSLRGIKDSALARVGRAQLEARKIDPESAVRNDLCKKFLEGQEKHPDLLTQDGVLGIIMSTIGAGADTTAGTLTYTLFFLSKYPATRERLMQEIEENRRAGTLSNPPKWVDVNRLPYLEAVLKESMRLLPIASWGLDRIVPAGGATIAGKFIPGGTIVGCHIDSVQRDVDVFGADSAVFRPERWLEADEDQKRRMNRSFLAFSAGKRICTGIHIAWLEMKKTLPLILMNFQIDLINPEENIEDKIRVSAVKYPPPIMAKISKRAGVE